jgi:hypothetical protein
MKLVGANSHAKVSGLEELPGKINYFIGNDPKKWRTNVPNYAKVKYASVYPGVDLVYYGNQGKLEYDFVVQPGADPRSIQLAIVSNEQVGSRQKAVGSKMEVQPESQSAIDNRQWHRPYMSTRMATWWWAPTAAKSSFTNPSSINRQLSASSKGWHVQWELVPPGQ